ncbi:AAA family ATPase [Hydrogenophaga sp. RWCD_12]|uniref:AAA family ATPase n=1 Tax=Hydrogenophaga sp. RWCD_12 TaxID=3391190 RepID=UPI00398530F4
MALVVTLLGGESTGKTTLEHALCAQLQALGLSTLLVPEHLRQWCEARGRAPHADEQAALALEQARLIDDAARQATLQVVIADTAPLVIAAYSELYFNDLSLLPDALRWQQTVGLTLLMGLDLPWVSDGFFRDSPAVRDATDAVLRRELQSAGLPFQTVYGQGKAREQQALRAIGRALGPSLGGVLLAGNADWASGRRPWSCEKCSDPDCEHRLFSGLLARSADNSSTH